MRAANVRGPHQYQLCPSAQVAHLKMVSVVTTEFVRNIHADPQPFSLIEQRGLVSRLIQEIRSAATDLARDPRRFLGELFSADPKDAKRRKRIYLGLACAVAMHVVLLAVIAVFGWRTVFVKPVEDTIVDNVTWVPPTRAEKPDSTQPDTPRGEGRGGGGGGQHSALPPSEGRPPRMRSLPQIVNLNPSSIPEPTLAVLPTVVGPDAPPPPPAPIGDPTGKSGEFSGGPGSDGGIGRGKGTGVGGGNDSGVGSGGRGGKGGATAGSPEGSGSNIPTVLDFNRLPSLAGYKAFRFKHRPTPVITPEAQENKVIGRILLRATFNADATITDIEVVSPLEFMTESAIDSLRRSTFSPATINGAPVTVRKVLIKIEVHY